MTSNIGSPYLIENIKDDGSVEDAVKERVLDEMKNCFRPEFLNRIDDITVFTPLTENDMVKIVEIALAGVGARLAEKNISVRFTDVSKRFIARETYSPTYGARPIKRYVQKNIETEIAARIIKGEIREGDSFTVDIRGNALSF
jgi:ATP-dependent Clp protease ATP-binding subunit ClpB